MNKKDQEAINHIAKVSKNPHAALIAKQLLTGWPVKIKETGRIIDSPFDIKDCEYELIEPHPIKPAYRVYVDSDGDTFTADRLPNGAIVQTFENDITWISDWIEYDPPKKWPTPLVERIAAIDIKAAEWIVDHWDDLLDNKYTNGGNLTFSRDSDLLKTMFSWNSSDLNGYYWLEISKKLGENP